VVRSRGDLVAFVPVALGFVPHDSVVMLTFDEEGSSFHARIDLPDHPGDDDEVVEALLGPALQHGIVRVVLLAFGAQESGERIVWKLRDTFLAAGIDVMDALVVADGRWRSVVPDDLLGEPAEGAVELESHRFTAQGVLDGHVRYGSREELRETVEANPDRIVHLPERGVRLLGAAELGRLVARHTADGSPFSDDDLVEVATSIALPRRRDAVWTGLDRRSAPAAVRLWRDAAARLGDEAAADVCAVLGFVAWLSGDGALAWCAVDRSQRVAPANTLAGLVAELLQTASSPRSWDEWREALHGPVPVESGSRD
jgi:hypothetical protein